MADMYKCELCGHNPNEDQDIYQRGVRHGRKELEAQLAALTWTPISESNLPKVGDEVGHWNPHTGKWEIASCRSDWKEGAICGNKWAYRRPLNPPSPERGANGNR